MGHRANLYTLGPAALAATGTAATAVLAGPAAGTTVAAAFALGVAGWVLGHRHGRGSDRGGSPASVSRLARQHFDLVRHLSLAPSLEDAADMAVEYAACVVGARRVSLMVADGDRLRIAAHRGLPDEVARETSVPIGERISGKAFATGRITIMQHDESRADRGGPSATVPLAAVPMRTAVRRVGVINVTDVPGKSFSKEQLAELKFVAEAAAIGLAGHLDRHDLEEANYAALQTLARTVEAKDAYTHGHSQRVETWSRAVGRMMGLSGAELETLSRGAALHDVGKLAVPDEILLAPRELSSEEWAVIRRHPVDGVRLVADLAFLSPARDVILYHHERLDGSGYPEGLKGDEIPIAARILAVVDSYDAMTGKRPYRPAMPHHRAAGELRDCAGRTLDPACVKAFLRLLEERQTPAPTSGRLPASVLAN